MDIQFPHNELSDLLEKIIPGVRQRKMKYFLLYSFFVIYFSIPSFQIPLLQYCSFRITALMEQRAIESNLFYYPEQKWIDIEEVNPVLIKAIISMEDGNFFNHRGIDWKELKISLNANERRGRTVRGASTITMQLAKNLYLSTGRSFFRKAKEFIISFRMEKETGKKSILENYLNAVEWGSGVFGVAKASEIYFQKTASRLSEDECARLAAVIPSPLIHHPDENSAYVLRRSSIIKKRLNDVIFPPDFEL